MTDKEINEAVARALGTPWLPYTEDRNLLPQLWEGIRQKGLVYEFCRELHGLTDSPYELPMSVFGSIIANPRVQAEAFLRALGLWTEGE